MIIVPLGLPVGNVNKNDILNISELVWDVVDKEVAVKLALRFIVIPTYPGVIWLK